MNGGDRIGVRGPRFPNVLPVFVQDRKTKPYGKRTRLDLVHVAL